MVNNFKEPKLRPLSHGSGQVFSNSCVLFVKLGKQVPFHVLNIHLISGFWGSMSSPGHEIQSFFTSYLVLHFSEVLKCRKVRQSKDIVALFP